MKLGLHLTASLMVCSLLTHGAIAGHSGHNGRSQTPSGTAAPKTKEAAAGDAIDTSITVNQGRYPGRSIKPRIANSPKAADTLKIGLTQQNVQIHRPASSAGSAAGPQRNAIGVVVGRDETVPNRNGAIPNTASLTTVTPSTPSSGSPPHAFNATPRNANTSVTNAGQGPIGNHPSGTLVPPPVNGPNINGTGLIRPGSGTGAVGGAAKVAVGVLSGNSFRPKHL